MKTKLIFAIVFVTCLLFAMACSSTEEAKTKSDGVSVSDAGFPVDSSSGYSDIATPDSSRMVVRTDNISLVVKDVTQTRDNIVILASKYQGYVVSSNFVTRGQNLVGSISIRVPEDKYESAMADIRALGVRVTAEQSNSQDVTAQYIDLQARLTNAQATEAQYLTFMTKAQQISEIIVIQDKLSQIRQTIEQIKGQMQYLENTSATSLISITLEPEPSDEPVVTSGWSFSKRVKQAAHGFVEFGKVFLTIVIWLAIFIPLWGAILVIIYFTYWRKQRRKPTNLPPPK